MYEVVEKQLSTGEPFWCVVDGEEERHLFHGTEEQCRDFAYLMNKAREERIALPVERYPRGS